MTPEVRPTITVMYSCPECSLVKEAVVVPARDIEDVVTWTNKTVDLCGQHHNSRSPHCLAKTLDLMVPMDNRAKIGGPRVQ